MKKKHKIVDAIKFVCAKKETGTLVVVTDDNTFATFSLIKGKLIAISFQGKRGIEALELVSHIISGVCRFRRDQVENNHDPLPDTDEIISHLLQSSQKRNPDTEHQETSTHQSAEIDNTLINTLTEKQQLIFETCLAEYVGAMAPILAEEYLEIETDIHSAINNLMLVVKNMSGIESAKHFRKNLYGELEPTGVENLL
ncbi:hypothetical protein ACVBE9_02590 [Eionea flava]